MFLFITFIQSLGMSQRLFFLNFLAKNIFQTMFGVFLILIFEGTLDGVFLLGIN